MLWCFGSVSSRMMDMMLLGLLSLSGRLIPSSCLLHQYHYVADPQTWDAARTFCRDTYTELATIENRVELAMFQDTLSSSSAAAEVWIGLQNDVVWRWSDDGGADYWNWEPMNNEPNFGGAGQFCVVISATGMWWDDYCNIEYPFFCYRGSQLQPELVVVNDVMNWSSAQRHCRGNHLDLVTVRNHTENMEIQSLVQDGGWAWIGLSREPLFSWSDGSRYSFANWGHVSNPVGSNTVLCAAAGSSGGWRLHPCDMTFPFVCYSVPAATVSRQLVKLRIEPDDSSVDVNEPAVKEDMLRKLQDRLKESTGSGITLKWREQPDGKVFHQEGKRSQKKQRKKTEL